MFRGFFRPFGWLAQWKFKPGEKDGAAVSVQVKIEMTFDVRYWPPPLAGTGWRPGSGLVPSGGRGTATGVYNFFGFIGSSLGGMLGGALIHLSPSLPELVGVLFLVFWYFLGLPSAPESAA